MYGCNCETFIGAERGSQRKLAAVFSILPFILSICVIFGDHVWSFAVSLGVCVAQLVVF